MKFKLGDTVKVICEGFFKGMVGKIVLVSKVRKMYEVSFDDDDLIVFTFYEGELSEI